MPEKVPNWHSVTLKRTTVARARAAGVHIQTVCEKALDEASEAMENIGRKQNDRHF